MAVVTFDYGVWTARYPEFSASVPQGLAQLYFNEATLYVDNTGTGPVQDAGQLAVLLNMVTAHIAALNAPVDGQAASPLVGRITNASEGSVSVGVQMDLPAGSAQWFAQTKYGIAFWQATSQFRTMRYVPGCAPVANPFSTRLY